MRFLFCLSSFFFFLIFVLLFLIQYVAEKKHYQPVYLKALHKTGFWMCFRFLTHYSLTTRSTDVQSMALKFATVVTFTEAMPNSSLTWCSLYFLLINQEKNVQSCDWNGLNNKTVKNYLRFSSIKTGVTRALFNKYTFKHVVKIFI